MDKYFALFMLLFLMIGPVSAMQIEADPRIINAFMDKSLPPELDILRVTTDISPDNHLKFQVKIRARQMDGEHNDYILLYIQHEKAYVLLMPLNQKEMAETISIYTGDLESKDQLTSFKFSKSGLSEVYTDFDIRYVDRGVEFTMPLEWIDFNADFYFDAYTVRAKLQDNTLQVAKIYDQARRGRPEEKRISAITLLNKICSPKK